MRRIVHPVLEDIPAIKKLFGRVELDMQYNGFDDSAINLFASKNLEELIASKSLYIEKDGAKVLGLLEKTHFYKDELLGEEAKQSAGFALLDEFGYKGENVLAFPCFFIDPMWMGKGLAKEFFQGVLAQYRETSFLLQANSTNLRAIAFFKKVGFFDLGAGKLKNPESRFLVKPYVPQGLCRNAFW